MHFAGVAYDAEAYVADSMDDSDSTEYYSNNTENTLKLLRAMAVHNVTKIVYSSSCATYGAPVRMPVTEETPQTPVNAYGRAKLETEQVLHNWVDSGGSLAKVAVLRYFNAIGADPQGRLGERPPKALEPNRAEYRRSSRVLTALFDAARWPSLYVSGNAYSTPDGTALRDYVHVSDLADAHVAVLGTMLRAEDKLPRYRHYNVGTGIATSVLEMARIVKEISNVEFEVNFGPTPTDDPPALWADASKISREASWSSKYPHIKDAIRHAWTFRQGLRKKPHGSLDLFAMRVDPAGVTLCDDFGDLDIRLRPHQSQQRFTEEFSQSAEEVSQRTEGQTRNLVKAPKYLAKPGI
jgi:UDP-arabinose 4-epimerase